MRLVTLLCVLGVSACGPSGSGVHGDGGAGDDDGMDAGVYPDGSGGLCTNPVDDGCGSMEICDDGLDNDCNGMVDDTCACTPGAVQACFAGPPGRRDVGACTDGTQRCIGMDEFSSWGACEGGLGPAPEACDGTDNDCNGCTDDTTGCTGDLMCPTSMPEAAPFEDYPIDGSMFYAGSVQSWTWSVQGGPCDQLLFSTSGTSSFTLAGAQSSNVVFHPTLSGDYTFTLTIVTGDGQTLTCTFIVHVRGPGFRTELCWDTTGSSDIDLHVHKPGTSTPWFTTTPTGSFDMINPDDCYYFNCKAGSYEFAGDQAEWGNASSPLSECQGSPEGADWSVVGSCHNPRLDIDNISEPGRPENVNIDNPAEGQTFRVMVHYYGGFGGETHPMVNVYCGGHLLGTYGAAPDTLAGFATPGGFGAGPMWRVVDVTTHVSGGTTTGCDLTPLHPASGMGYDVTNNDRTY